ncbi:hypothetical protein ERC79_18645 [Rhodococcus sp. ABRD24]|uniref:hypothetical protein n=1 Tax=Rhodococcus sp. ABRD24 TaxID=2507582 RepID=UPI00103D7BA7|nr:hypothetical protein [Rhodococcus sp. ABRD24]QBJ97732.1 hypothetical protein ERC79_18645 [Rhodococcus sp. ABRD24]
MAAEFETYSYLIRYLDGRFRESIAGRQVVELLGWFDELGSTVESHVLASRIREQETADLVTAVDAEHSRLAEALEAALRKINPATIDDLQWCIGTASTIRGWTLLEQVGLERLLWIVGAAGGDPSAPKGAYFARFCALAVQWIAVEELRGLVSFGDAGVGAPGVQYFPQSSMVARMMPMVTHFRWATLAATREILLCAGDPDLPPRVADEFAHYIEYFDSPVFGDELSAVGPPMSSELREIACDCSVAAGELADMPFVELMATLDLTMRPFVRVGEALIPAGLQSLNSRLHITVFAYLARRLGQQHMSAAFEHVCARLLTELAGTGFRALESGSMVRIEDGNPGEIDFAVTDSSTIFVGEAKSRSDSRDPHAAERNFVKQITEAIDQVDKRVWALNAGSPLISDGQELLLRPEGRVFGLVVTLHDYSGGIRNAAALDMIRAGRSHAPAFSVMDIVLLARTLRGADEFVDYVSFRQDLLHDGLLFSDELDAVAAFLEDAGGYRSQLDQLRGVPKVAAIMPPRNVTKEQLLETDPPGLLEQWRSTVAALPKSQVPGAHKTNGGHEVPTPDDSAAVPGSDRPADTVGGALQSIIEADVAAVSALAGVPEIAVFAGRPRLRLGMLADLPALIVDLDSPRPPRMSGRVDRQRTDEVLRILSAEGFCTFRSFEQEPLPLLEDWGYILWPTRVFIYAGRDDAGGDRKLLFQSFMPDHAWHQGVLQRPSGVLALVVGSFTGAVSMNAVDFEGAMARGEVLAAAVTGICAP